MISILFANHILQHAVAYTTSLMTLPLTESQINSLVSILFANIKDSSARHSWEIFLEMHGGEKSAITRVNSTATAYAHRDKFLLFQFLDTGTNGHIPEEGFTILKTFIDSVTHFMADADWGMYANFLDTQLAGNDAQRLYWGDNLPRLRRIKADLDPRDVFWNPQGISPSV